MKQLTKLFLVCVGLTGMLSACAGDYYYDNYPHYAGGYNTTIYQHHPYWRRGYYSNNYVVVPPVTTTYVYGDWHYRHHNRYRPPFYYNPQPVQQSTLNQHHPFYPRGGTLMQNHPSVSGGSLQQGHPFRMAPQQSGGTGGGLQQRRPVRMTTQPLATPDSGGLTQHRISQ